MIIPHIISQHAEESAFLWMLRDNALKAPHYSLKDLATLEERINAHLDGLRVASEEAWPFCVEGLAFEESGEVFTAGFIALDQSREDWLAAVMEVAEAAPEASRGLISALGWVPREKLRGHVVGWLQSDNPLRRLVGVSACAIQRVDCGRYLQKAVQDGDAFVRARALRSVGEIRRRDLKPAVLEHLNDSDAHCRFEAAWSATLLGESRGIDVLRNIVEATPQYREIGMELLVRAMDRAEAVEWIRGMNNKPDFARLVVQASGRLGDSVAVPWLIHKMKTSELARVAGESFSFITGIDLAYSDLERDQPEGFVAGPTEDPEDHDVAMDADEDLPWPDPDRITDWWATHHESYPTGRRLLCGQSISPTTCAHVLRTGGQRQRVGAALEQAILSPGALLFNTSAPAKEQSRSLGV